MADLGENIEKQIDAAHDRHADVNTARDATVDREDEPVAYELGWLGLFIRVTISLGFAIVAAAAYELEMPLTAGVAQMAAIWALFVTLLNTLTILYRYNSDFHSSVRWTLSKIRGFRP